MSMPSNRSMSVASERDLMHNSGNGGLGVRGCATTWKSRALALSVGVVGVFLLAMIATGGASSSGSNDKSSKPRFTNMSAGAGTLNDKGAIDNNDDAILPAGELLNDDRPYITLFGTIVIPAVAAFLPQSNPLYLPAVFGRFYFPIKIRIIHLSRIIPSPFSFFPTTAGDSLTQYSWNPTLLGYASLLANTYTRRADFKNRGVSGYTTRDALRVLDSVFPLGEQSWVQAHAPALVVILLGSNDQVRRGSWVEATTGEDHHVPLDEYKANYKKILTHLRTLREDLPLVLVTPPPVVDDVKGARTNAAVKEYRDVVLFLGKEKNVPVFDLWEACEGSEVEKFKAYLVDGLHLNGQGNTVLYEGLMGVIEKHYPDLLPEGKKMPKRERDPWES